MWPLGKLRMFWHVVRFPLLSSIFLYFNVYYFLWTTNTASTIKHKRTIHSWPGCIYLWLLSFCNLLEKPGCAWLWRAYFETSKHLKKFYKKDCKKSDKRCHNLSNKAITVMKRFHMLIESLKVINGCQKVSLSPNAKSHLTSSWRTSVFLSLFWQGHGQLLVTRSLKKELHCAIGKSIIWWLNLRGQIVLNWVSNVQQ